MILLVLLASIAISLGLAALIVRQGRAKADRALADLGARRLTAVATALGTDADAGPFTATGTLVLTDEELAFAQWRPARVLRVRRSDVITAAPVREHLGRTMRSDVLQVTWQGPEVEHAVAFFVRDLEPWLRDLGARRR